MEELLRSLHAMVSIHGSLHKGPKSKEYYTALKLIAKYKNDGKEKIGQALQ